MNIRSVFGMLKRLHSDREMWSPADVRTMKCDALHFTESSGRLPVDDARSSADVVVVLCCRLE